ncbi:hypothetical protein VPHG_00115 [Vibrio phage 11895-B1]|uniref:hypothetical protein n=1 Tax=Vibrio phage 11895-B1 TaxID=754075 RepID=UPI0002C09FF6|nr:hypothetical protein VPHG_00115 [Vibrio phage 11895-B1]AGH32182.1 hypothetical protein VPHG_00115 [Vibrio phage 11895-B1]
MNSLFEDLMQSLKEAITHSKQPVIGTDEVLDRCECNGMSVPEDVSEEDTIEDNQL